MTHQPPPAGSDQTPREGPEPEVRGTVFLTILMLMLMVGLWVIMYLYLLAR